MKRIFFIGSIGLGQEYGIGTYLDGLLEEGSRYTGLLQLILINFEIVNDLKKTEIIDNGNITRVLIPLIKTNGHIFQDPLILSGLINLLGFHFKVNKNDIFHINSISATILAVRIKEKLKSKIVYTSHIAAWREYFESAAEFQEQWTLEKSSSSKWDYITLEYELCKVSDKIICLSTENIRLFEKVFKLKKEKLFLIANGLQTNYGPIAGNCLFSERLSSANQTVILYCGRIDKDKGIDELFSALSIVQKQRTDFIFLLVGGGDVGSYMANHTNLWGHVFTTGYVRDRSVLNWLYQTSHIQVLPSKYEQSSFALLEGLRHGKAIILSSISAFKEVEPPNCLKVPLNTSPQDDMMQKSIAESILYLMKNPDVRQKIGSNAAALFEKQFNLSDKFALISEYAYGVRLN